MNKLRLSTLITDLDNTFYDWVHIWYSSFLPMIDMVQEIGQFDRELLLDDVREVHQAKGTSEYAFLIEELKCVKEKYKQKSEIVSIFQPAIDAYLRRVTHWTDADVQRERELYQRPV